MFATTNSVEKLSVSAKASIGVINLKFIKNLKKETNLAKKKEGKTIYKLLRVFILLSCFYFQLKTLYLNNSIKIKG